MSEVEKKHSLEKRLASYKAMHSGTAKNKKCFDDFMSTKTLTQARKVLWGTKKKAVKVKK